MIKPSEKIKELSDLIIASSTSQEGLMGRNFMTQTDNVSVNQEKFFAGLGIAPDKIMRVVVANGNRIKIIDSPQKMVSGIDGIVTDKKGIYFAVLTADCIPLVIYDCRKKVLAFIHVGWRGVVGSLVKKAIKKMKRSFDCQTADMSAYLGPAIEKDCYKQTGWRALIKKRILFSISGNKEFTLDSGKQISFDIVGAAKKQLIDSGISGEKIETSPYCTFCRSDLLPSHLREGNSRESSMMTVAGIK